MKSSVKSNRKGKYKNKRRNGKKMQWSSRVSEKRNERPPSSSRKRPQSATTENLSNSKRLPRNPKRKISWRLPRNRLSICSNKAKNELGT
mgnify:CR=1 FL=1